MSAFCMRVSIVWDLMDALRYAPADTVKMQLNTGISPCIITPVDDSDNFLYMVLPVRLKAQ